MGKLRSVRDFSKQHRCDIIYLLEHKLKPEALDSISWQWSDFDAANNNSSTPSGRILTLWNTHSMALLKLAESEQFIHFEVQP